MKITAFFSTAAMTVLPSFGLAEEKPWLGPEWATASCPFNEQVVAAQGNKGLTTIVHDDIEGDNVEFRWWPTDAYVTVLCGDESIIFSAHSLIVLEVMVPPYFSS